MIHDTLPLPATDPGSLRKLLLTGQRRRGRCSSIINKIIALVLCWRGEYDHKDYWS